MQASFLIILLVWLLAGPALATGQSEKTLLKELRALAEKARREQAADRWLQRALDDLVARYDRPWQRTLFFDDFRDGDFSRNPHWELLEGHFEVLRNRGLVAWDDSGNRPGERNTRDDTRRKEDLGAALVGALLQQALGPGPENRETESPRPNRYGPDRLRARVNATNAFALSATLGASEEPPTHLELALLQSTKGHYGYRLRLQTGRRGFVELERIRNGRGAIVENVPLKQAFADGRLHDLAWQQTPDGTVKVMLDEKPLFQVRDRAFRDGYPWLELRHDGGDLTLRALRIEGT
ncbi:MAG: hypothetical protein D6720_07285 [Gammaproteobacteria bacterium]|nr:MAG: hypothetical protein D6720_07285 [Gammaproteobacteria bacterium]